MPTINGRRLSDEAALNLQRLVFAVMGESCFSSSDLIGRITPPTTANATALRDAIASALGGAAITDQRAVGRLVAGCGKVRVGPTRVRRIQHPIRYMFAAYLTKD